MVDETEGVVYGMNEKKEQGGGIEKTAVFQ